MVSMFFRDPQALSSTLASLGTLQPRAFGSLNQVETLNSASNYYVVNLCAFTTDNHICVCVFTTDNHFQIAMHYLI